MAKYKELLEKVDDIKTCLCLRAVAHLGDRLEILGECQDLIDKLAQLENDIESKKLQRLNCNVGDTIYYVAYYKVETDNREIEILEPWLVDSLVIGKDYQIYRLTHEGTDDYNSAHNIEFGEKWFTDKEKALAKLQELKEQNNERLDRK